MNNTILSRIATEEGQMHVFGSQHIEENPQGTLLAVPGFGHGGNSFDHLANKLAEEGFSTMALTYTAEHFGPMKRNTIGIQTYVEMTRTALQVLAERGIKITGVMGHSMGGEIVRRMQSPLPQTLISPIPLQGALGPIASAAIRNPRAFVRFGKSFFSEQGLQTLTEEDVQQFFFTPDTPLKIVQETREMLIHTPLKAFLDIARPSPKKPQEIEAPIQYILSPDDKLFPPPYYNDINPSQVEHVDVEGGHDALISTPDEIARHIARFHASHTTA